ncbi:transglycosylase domain-containing protein [Desulfobacter curvatus]|uniref:transglycosylase domain-containing protein n=1 Tax=Desulfobacter curvatus TaxID=2290 RepID=UPI000477C6C4|nr:transglycosylase domain-containing protein [Desulfobacter curvatus]
MRLMKAGARRKQVWRTIRRIFTFLLILAVLLGVIYELQTSKLQAHYLSRLAAKICVRVDSGKSTSVQFPTAGPYDTRLGYVELPTFLRNLDIAGYDIEAQARFSPFLLEYTQAGFYPAYREKSNAGLRIEDRLGRLIYVTAYPERIFSDYSQIPDIIVKILLYIENRELLDPRYPLKNPAVEWKRLTAAALELGIKVVDNSRNVPGGSTLATQIEKYRHSPQGLTLSVKDKFQQMVSASMRAYLDGKETLQARYGILCDFINSMPLGAITGYGEVMGLGDGLYAWYGADFTQTVRLLAERPLNLSGSDVKARAVALKQVVSLFVAQRRPSYYLLQDHPALKTKTDTYLRLLARVGIITPRDRDAAIEAPLVLQERVVLPKAQSFLHRKALNAVRVQLLNLLDVDRLYRLDRFDLSVTSTVDQSVQQETTTLLKSFSDPLTAQKNELYGYHLLGDGDPSNIVYSLTLYERSEGANFMRLQTDTLDQPLNINSGTKLELGSSAKFRTLATYLEIVAALHEQHHSLSRAELAAVEVDPADDLSRWVISYLSGSGDRALSAMLNAAMQRSYSASPEEQFFTGGGVHTFSNFDTRHDARMFSVQDAFNHSINLVFIRMMRDITQYYKYQIPGVRQLLADANDPRRHDYLAKFADQEGQIFLQRFYRKYAGKSFDEAFDILLEGMRQNPKNLAAAFRYIKPAAGLKEFEAFLSGHLKNGQAAGNRLQEFFEISGPHAYSLVELGYVTRVHPLELWTLAYLNRHPDAGQGEVIQNSAAERQEVYTWLFKTSRKNKQDVRIRALLEVEAFSEIFSEWKRLKYPFNSLVPSYATAIGSSADRPDSLAELVGIVLNKGKWYPTIQIQKLCFGEKTPYETRLAYQKSEGKQVMHPEVAKELRQALLGVVESGTARRIHNAFLLSDGTYLAVGGKTGTGDNRHNIYNSDGQLIESKAINRTAVFVFFIGDRFYGVVTAYVAGQDSDDYTFTSALAVQILKAAVPKLMPLLTGGG